MPQEVYKDCQSVSQHVPTVFAVNLKILCQIVLSNSVVITSEDIGKLIDSYSIH